MSDKGLSGETICDRAEGMVELLKDNDGRPIHVGDTVFVLDECCRSWHVVGLSFGQWQKNVKGDVVHAVSPVSGEWRDLMPDWLTHERPDSWGRIADELDAWTTRAAGKCEAFGIEEDALHELAERVRRLAREEADDVEGR